MRPARKTRDTITPANVTPSTTAARRRRVEGVHGVGLRMETTSRRCHRRRQACRRRWHRAYGVTTLNTFDQPDEPPELKARIR